MTLLKVDRVFRGEVFSLNGRRVPPKLARSIIKTKKVFSYDQWGCKFFKLLPFEVDKILSILNL